MVGIKKVLLNKAKEKEDKFAVFNAERLAIQSLYEPSKDEMKDLVGGYHWMSPLQQREWSTRIRIARQLEAGILPLEFDKSTLCEHCGPVLTDFGGKCKNCPWCPTFKVIKEWEREFNAKFDNKDPVTGKIYKPLFTEQLKREQDTFWN